MKDEMDSKDVAKALEAEVFPILRDAGFSRFKTRTAWRPREHVVDVLDFRSLGSYLASAIGATSHSFGSATGVYYKAMHAVPWAVEAPPELPEEPHCQARRILSKSIFQIWCRRPDVWYVGRRGRNLGRVMADVRRAVREQALPWLERYGELERALEAFERQKESEMRPGIMLEVLGGELDSFARAEAACALALACGQRDRARRALERLLANPYYERITDIREKAEQRLALI
jgi:hypothetical protein